MKKRYLRSVCLIMALILFWESGVPVYATSITELQNDIKNQQKKLNDVNKQINSYKGAQADIGEEIEELDAEIVSLLTDINLIEASIADTEEKIAQTQIEYDAAVEEKDTQYESMKIRVKYMYEKGDVSYMQMLLEAQNMGDMMNKAHYVEKLYEYDRKLLEEYEQAVLQVEALWDALEEEKSELKTSKAELEDEQAYVQEVLNQKKEEYENYSVVLAKAKQEAATYTAKIKQETAQIKKLEEEERKRREEEERKRKEAEAALAASQSAASSSGSSYVPPIPSSSGSGKGQQIASYACQFIGNPYVAGGTSLTNGADCSGFVMSVYKAFGISLPRSSYAQSAVGRGVSYAEAQPGDIIYYGGHVGIYIGNGQIVHASTERTGIKITNATYRSIITVRRIV